MKKLKHSDEEIKVELTEKIVIVLKKLSSLSLWKQLFPNAKIVN